MTIQDIAPCAACERDARHAHRYECTGGRSAGILVVSLIHYTPPVDLFIRLQWNHVNLISGV